MNSMLPEKSEIGIWYKKVEFELDRFIFVAPKPMLSAIWKLEMTHRSIRLPDFPAFSQVRRYSLLD